MTSPISSAMIPHDASISEQSRREMQSKLGGIALNARMDPAVREKKLREACEGFESIFIQKMWQEMRNTVPKGGMMHSQRERIWQDMYDQELSKSMSRAGGIGLAEMMYEQLSRNLVSATRNAVGGGSGPAFMPTAAPLLPEPEEIYEEAGEEDASQPVAASAKTPSVYDGAAPQTGFVDTGAGETARNEAQDGAGAAQTAAALAARPELAPVRPVQAPVVQGAQPVAAAEAAGPERKARHRKHANRHYPGGLDLAQAAFRDAGDKLGPGAIRAPLHPRREQAVHTEALRQPVQQPASGNEAAPAPGSPEALRAAMNLARSGQHSAYPEANAPGATGADPLTGPVASPARGGVTGQAEAALQLNELVSQVQARNSVRAAREAAARNHAQPILARDQTEQEATAGAGAAPKVTKVTYSTNIPGSGKRGGTGKGARQAIRMLNVDNVGLNSKAGAGIAAYHEARDAANAADAAKTASRDTGAQAAAQGQAAQPAPLTASADLASQPDAMRAAAQARPGRSVRNVAAEAMGLENDESVAIRPLTADMASGGNASSFAIPPLTAHDSRSQS